MGQNFSGELYQPAVPQIHWSRPLASKNDSAKLYRLCTSTDLVDREKGFQELGRILFCSARKQLNYNQFDDAFVEDCVQKSLLTIWKNISADRGPKSAEAFVGWTCRITRNKCIDEIRSAKRKATDSLDGSDTYDGAQKPEHVDIDAPNPEEEALRTEKISLLIDAIEERRLSQNAKTVLLEGYLFGKTDAELSKMIGTTDANVKVIRSRALEKLRNDDDFLTALRQFM